MLWMLLVVLMSLWLLGLLTGHVLGGLIHILLPAALVVLGVCIYRLRAAAIARNSCALKPPRMRYHMRNLR